MNRRTILRASAPAALGIAVAIAIAGVAPAVIEAPTISTTDLPTPLSGSTIARSQRSWILTSASVIERTIVAGHGIGGSGGQIVH